MPDPAKMLISSLINDGKVLATSFNKAKIGPSTELEAIHTKVEELVPRILEQLQNAQLPASFPEKIIPKILEKVQRTLQKFTELDPEKAAEYEKLIKRVNDCKSQKQKNLAVRSSSSIEVEQIESPTGDSTQLQDSASDVPQQDEFRSLTIEEKKCLFCFCLFPAGKEVKKREPMHLWVGMDLIADPCKGAQMLDKLVGGGFVERTIANKKMFTRYKMKRHVRSMVIKEMNIEFSQENPFSIMDQNQQQQQQRASQEQPISPQQQRKQEQAQPQQQQSPSQQLASKNPFLAMTNRMSLHKLRSATSNHKNQDDMDYVSGALVLNISENSLQATTFEKISKENINVKMLLLGSWLHDSKKYIVIEEVEAALKALTRHIGQVTFLSLQGISGIVDLPDSVYKLENLKVLDLRGCPNLESLSNGMESLKRLTHLDLSECYLLEHIPKGIASLAELRVLKGFVINPKVSPDEDPSVQNGNDEIASSCASFSELKALKKLIKLTIRTRRPNFPTTDDFKTLGAMNKLSILKIVWVGNSNDAPSVSYSGSCPISLDKLELQATPEDTMSRLLMLISKKLENSLKKLYIRGGRFWELGKELGCFNHVHKVRLRYLHELRIDWAEFSEYFPNLNRLEVLECPNLRFFPCDENGVWEDT